MPSVFRTYEAQSRLLAAVIASLPTVKLDYSAIALHYGSDATRSSVEHRFRPIKQQASLLRQAVASKEDAKELASIFLLGDKEIAKYYGESTRLGIEFQFRAIKKEAKAMRDGTYKEQASPLPGRKTAAAGTSIGAGAATPTRKRKTPATPATPVTPANAGASTNTVDANAGAGSGPPAKRARCVAEGVFSNGEDGDGCSTLASEEVDYELLDLTPASTPSHRMAMPSNTPSLTLAVSSVGPITPTTTASTSGAATTTAFLPDSTPALSAGVSPPDQASPDHRDVVFHTAVQHQQQPVFYPHYGNGGSVGNSFTIDDSNANDNHQGHMNDDDDDDVFIIDTPSRAPKVPKMEPSAPPSTATLHHNVADHGWENSSHTLSQTQVTQTYSQPQPQSQSQSQGQFSFDASGSASWAPLDLFPAGANDVASMSFGESGSLFDTDGTI
ncbi:hypothetical protein HMPREF1624_00396 [Sporothrix schenckii ATCC 58251]|uniref:Uncharacterized protein n=1 Tax=Sporothrix schenckii (strain ATCC 58251 / de Perez 2211183) TaxID=1391915 RepID=U7Q2H7_SPOS1|nr:hypothetical protein HMPREF1624_00396 [Sporothrix schenckii ATCC 58251]